MGVENLCIEKGCPGACCRNVPIIMDGTQLGNFVDGIATQEVTLEQFQVIADIADIATHEGVFFYDEQSGRYVVQVVGNCPHLDQSSFYCTRYKKRPNGCRGIAVGSQRCASARQSINLQPVE